MRWVSSLVCEPLSSRRKLAELVTDHLLRHPEWNVLLSIVHVEHDTNVVGQDSRSTGFGVNGNVVRDGSL